MLPISVKIESWMDIFKAVFRRDIKIKDGRECSKSQDNLSGKNKTFNNQRKRKKRERKSTSNKLEIYLEYFSNREDEV